MNREPSQEHGYVTGRVLAAVAALTVAAAGTYGVLHNNEANANDTAPIENSVEFSNLMPITTLESTTTTVDTTAREIAELRSALTVDGTNFQCATNAVETKTVTVAKLANGSSIVVPRDLFRLPVDNKSKDQDHRLYSDALANPLTSEVSKPEALANEVFASLCEDRLLAVTYANMFANLKVGDVSVLSLNPWLDGYQGDPKVINDIAETFPAHQNDINDKSDLVAYQQHVELAQNIAELFGRFQKMNVADSAQKYYYHLDPNTVVQLGIPEVAMVEGSYDKINQFVRFALTLKSGKCVSGTTLGVNIHDQRPALLEDVKECQPVVTTTVAPTTNPPTSTILPNRKKRRETTVPERTTTIVHTGRTTTVVDRTVPNRTTTLPPTTKPEETTTTKSATTTTKGTLPSKIDDGKLPGNTLVPADQDKGTADVAGKGPAGQTPNSSGYLPTEVTPTSQAPRVETATTTAATTPPAPASTSPRPTSTDAPTPVTQPATSLPPGSIPAKP